MTWGGFSAALKHAVENRIELRVAGAEKHRPCILMTCHSLWKSLCAPEHEEWLRDFMSTLLLLLLSSPVLQRWARNAYDLRHLSAAIIEKKFKRHFSTVFSSHELVSDEISGYFCLYHLCWYWKVSFLTWHVLNRKKTPRGSLGIRLPNVLGLLESTEEKYK